MPSIAAVDNSFLCVLFDRGVRPGQSLDAPTLARRRKQIDYLISTLSENRSRLVIPTPALAELLMMPGLKLDDAIERIDREAVFQIHPFDARAAMEMSRLSVVGSGEDKFKGQESPWAKVKFDRQIVAIAKVTECEAIYTHDGPMKTLAEREGLTVFTFDHLQDPPAEDVPIPGLEPNPAV